MENTLRCEFCPATTGHCHVCGTTHLTSFDDLVSQARIDAIRLNALHETLSRRMRPLARHVIPNSKIGVVRAAIEQPTSESVAGELLSLMGGWFRSFLTA